MSDASGKRIVHVTALGISARLFLSDIFRALGEAGYEQWLACADDADARVTAETTPVKLLPIPMVQGMAPLRDMAASRELDKALRDVQPDIVHAHMSKGGIVGMSAARCAEVPVRIYHNHGMALLSARGFKRWLLTAVERRTNQLATHVLFCSDSTRQAAIDRNIAEEGKSRVLGDGTICGIDVGKFHPQPDDTLRRKQRQAWGIPQDTVVAGFVGRLVPHKGLATLVEAWRRVHEAHGAAARLALVGGDAPPQIDQILQEAVGQNIGIHRVGWCDDMISAYAAMDMLVLPSWHEGFPYSVLESQATGLPSVVTRATGNVDAVRDGRTGLIVPVRDPAALAEAIGRLVQDAEFRRQLGTQAARRIVEHFSRETVVGNLVKFYRELTAPASR